LKNAYIAATLRCAPPENKPLPRELANCRPYFERELELIRPRAILALGSIAMRAYLGMLKERGEIESLTEFPFRHGASYRLPGELPRLFASYHPSQQNTFTGKLTEEMLARVLRDIRRFLGKGEPCEFAISGGGASRAGTRKTRQRSRRTRRSGRGRGARERRGR
jgi:uracil-DNA glycosylase